MTQWHAMRFVPDLRKVEVRCAMCDRAMFLPPSKAGKYATCSEACRDLRSEAVKAARARDCETCGKTFVPRTTQLAIGQGRFCSQACNAPAHAAGNQPDVRVRAVASRRASRLAGKWAPLSGEQNPRWSGGTEASKRRFKESGLSAAKLRDYRKKNPHNVKEFALRRRDRREYGKRLPRGTIEAIGTAQRWRCAICSASIKTGYHVDHIQPLARGGKHEPRNIQLTCPSCNVRKNAKDPIDYMRSLGRLL